ncbi:MAG: hypothetical protein R2549_02630 [Candidatus Scalindua sp.]|nr:hypothetical protein [Candidatus Scalindua sp.]
MSVRCKQNVRFTAKGLEERGKRKEERGKRKEERGKRKEERVNTDYCSAPR